MKIDGVVVDASPLIILCRGRLIYLLPQLFPAILIPGAVWNEIIAGGAADDAARQLAAFPWAQRIEVTEVLPDLAAWNLGAGESEVLALARVVHKACAPRKKLAQSASPRR